MQRLLSAPDRQAAQALSACLPGAKHADKGKDAAGRYKGRRTVRSLKASLRQQGRPTVRVCSRCLSARLKQLLLLARQTAHCCHNLARALKASHTSLALSCTLRSLFQRDAGTCALPKDCALEVAQARFQQVESPTTGHAQGGWMRCWRTPRLSLAARFALAGCGACAMRAWLGTWVACILAWALAAWAAAAMRSTVPGQCRAGWAGSQCPAPAQCGTGRAGPHR